MQVPVRLIAAKKNMKTRLLRSQVVQIQDLRASGKTLNEIVAISGIKKSTVWYYIRNLQVKHSNPGLRAAALARWARARCQADVQADKEFECFSKEPLFTLGLGLYWGEGRKTQGTVSLVNNDIGAIKLFRLWGERYLDIGKWALYLRHASIDEAKQVEESLGLKVTAVYESNILRTRSVDLRAITRTAFVQRKINRWLKSFGSEYVPAINRKRKKVVISESALRT